jgi:hypothetical protein
MGINLRKESFAGSMDWNTWSSSGSRNPAYLGGAARI